MEIAIIKKNAKAALKTNRRAGVLSVLLQGVVLMLALVSLFIPFILVFGVLTVGSAYLFKNIYSSGTFNAEEAEKLKKGTKIKSSGEITGLQLFYGFNNYLNNLLLSCAKLLTCLLGFVLIFPGIYFCCKLKFVYYISNDNDQKSIKQCFNESWSMTKGYEFKIFAFWLF